MDNFKPELLCPAGDITRLKCAVDFGADAVYFAGTEFGMRAGAENFNPDQMAEGIEYAHSRGVRAHITVNTLMHPDEMAALPDFIAVARDAGADAFIVTDLGAMKIVREVAPNAEIHASVQMGVVNAETACVLHEMGAKRIVVARELTLDEISKIRANTPKSLELEAFAHGAVCMSYSGRCLLSMYMTGRDANRGDCAQPCRWSYSLVEQKRPGELYDISETDKGSYILNANDMCMAEHISDMVKAGISSFKIEGRAKSHYYVAVTTNAYRGAIDAYMKNPDLPVPTWVMDELNKISHRTYSTGFYFGRTPNMQTYENGGYIRDYAVAAVVEGYEDGLVIARLKNKFFRGTELDCLEPENAPFMVATDQLYDQTGAAIESAPHPMQIIKIPFEREIKVGSLLRMKA